MKGCYSAASNGRAEVRITKTAGQYAGELKDGDRWTQREAFHSASAAEMTYLFAQGVSSIGEGLMAKDIPFGVFRMKRAKTGTTKDAATTDYVVFLFLGAMPAFKVACE